MKFKTLLILSISAFIIQILNMFFLVETYPIASIIISSIVTIAAFTFTGIGAVISLVAIIAVITTGGFVHFPPVANVFILVGIVSAFANATACSVAVVNNFDKEKDIEFRGRR